VPGTAYRMDGVPIPLRAILPTALPSDEYVLREIRQRLDDPPEIESRTLFAIG
jgi:Formylmethanofuran dehydrogenase subunit B